MNISTTISETGLPIGRGETNLTYLYGISDFFDSMFEDTSVHTLLLEADSVMASEIYSKFLQYTSTLSLADIQSYVHSGIELILLDVGADSNGYDFPLPKNLLGAKYLANRPFLPTEVLEQAVDFEIYSDSNGASRIKFAEHISAYSLPRRVLSGVEQFAVWATDCHIDEQVVSKTFGPLVKVDITDPSESFANLLYGLFFTYTNGPTIDVIRKGLNLCLGLPLAREEEEVLAIRKQMDGENYVVICENNQYLIPYGLTPSVIEGDVLALGQSLSDWIEVKDYVRDGDWWVNLHIPERLIPFKPPGQKDRYATSGSHFDYLMRNFLKANTFLVNVKVTTFKNIQSFIQLAEIINTVKPSYAECIYVWVVDSLKETIVPKENVVASLSANWHDPFKVCITRFTRDSLDPVSRKYPYFMRYNAQPYVDRLTGTDEDSGAYTSYLGSDVFHGVSNPYHQTGSNTNAHLGWIDAEYHRGPRPFLGSRGKVGFFRNHLIGGGSHHSIGSFPASQVSVGERVLPLYVEEVSSLSNRLDALGLPVIGTGVWSMSLFKPAKFSNSVNSVPINASPVEYSPSDIKKYYSQLFFRGPLDYIGPYMPDLCKMTWAPPLSEINDGDYLLLVKITSTSVGVYWVTSNTSVYYPPFFKAGVIDPMAAAYYGKLTRGAAVMNIPFYLLRGDKGLNNNTPEEINGLPVNQGAITSTSEFSYVDKFNAIEDINRNGTKIQHHMEYV